MSLLIIIIYLLVLVCLYYVELGGNKKQEEKDWSYSWQPGLWWCSILVSRGRYCLFVCHDCYKYLTHLLADTRQQSGLFNPNIPTSSAQVEKSGEELIPPASSG